MTRRKITTRATALGLTLALCAVTMTAAWAAPPGLQPIPHRFEVTEKFTTLEQQFVNLGTGAERLHIQNTAQWQAFLRRFSIANPPDIDFHRHDVLIALMGVKGSSGYSIHITAADAAPTGTLVTVLHCLPLQDGSAGYLAVMTAPYDMRLAPKLATPVEWQIAEGNVGKGVCALADSTPSTTIREKSLPASGDIQLEEKP
jgi:hypothetical protein